MINYTGKSFQESIPFEINKEQIFSSLLEVNDDAPRDENPLLHDENHLHDENLRPRENLLDAFLRDENLHEDVRILRVSVHNHNRSLDDRQAKSNSPFF